MSKRWVMIPLVLLLLLGLVLEFLLPLAILARLNQELAAVPEYRGSIARVDIQWWERRVRLFDMRFVKRENPPPQPLLHAPTVDVLLQGPALQQGRFLARLEARDAVLELYDRPGISGDQFGLGPAWVTLAKGLVPLRIDAVHAEAKLLFHAPEAEPPVELTIDDIVVEMQNLTNFESAPGPRYARVVLDGKLNAVSPINMQVNFSPSEKPVSFATDLNLESIRLVQLRDAAQYYFGLGPERGRAKLRIQVEAAQKLDGELRIWTNDLTWKSADEAGLGELAITALADIGTFLLEGPFQDELDISIPLHGDNVLAAADLPAAVIGALPKPLAEAIRKLMPVDGFVWPWRRGEDVAQAPDA